MEGGVEKGLKEIHGVCLEAACMDFLFPPHGPHLQVSIHPSVQPSFSTPSSLFSLPASDFTFFLPSSHPAPAPWCELHHVFERHHPQKNRWVTVQPCLLGQHDDDGLGDGRDCICVCSCAIPNTCPVTSPVSHRKRSDEASTVNMSKHQPSREKEYTSFIVAATLFKRSVRSCSGLQRYSPWTFPHFIVLRPQTSVCLSGISHGILIVTWEKNYRCFPQFYPN